jgi:hypothetical protein
MVKELEDSPRDEIAVVLDANAAAVVGESFDVQVRAAGSLLLAHARRGRRAVLVVNGAQRIVQRVHSYDSDWRQAYDLLAAAEPDGHAPAAALLNDDSGSVARALELTVVTSLLTPQLVDKLLQRTLSRRRTALVFVDPKSFNGIAPVPQPALLRLQSVGVPVATLRRGDNLAAKLSGAALARVAGG